MNEYQIQTRADRGNSLPSVCGNCQHWGGSKREARCAPCNHPEVEKARQAGTTFPARSQIDWCTGFTQIERWRTVGRFTEGAPWRDERPVNEDTMREELLGYLRTFPHRPARVVAPDGSILESW